MRTFNISKNNFAILLFFVVFAIVSRWAFANNLPFSGDEVGVGVMQATGQAIHYKESLPIGNVPISKVKELIDFSADYGVREVFQSLRYEGMHPPFYYLLLHYIIRYFNNDAITLRFISLVFSVLSIPLIFYLGKVIHSEFLGLLSALFLTFSAYSLQYSVMVRPYPLLMFLSILSTLIIYILVTNNEFDLKNFGCYLYILISVIGLYTMYHYIFVIFFQACWSVLALRNNLRRVLQTALIYLFIGLLFIPWLPYLKDQIEIINNGNYYFHAQKNFILFFYEILHNNYLLFPFQSNPLGINLSLIKLIPFIAVLFIWILGLRNMLKNKPSRILFIALLGYLIVHFASDWMMESSTITIPKFQFFLVPIFFITFAFGFINLPNRYVVKTSAILITISLLLLSSMTIFRAKINYDGPAITSVISTHISNSMTTENTPTLFIVNSSTRRYLLPIVHSIESPIDIMVLTDQDINTSLSQIHDIDQYESVIIGNILTFDQTKQQLSHNEIQLIGNFLNKKRFTSKDPLLSSSYGTLVQFTK